MIFSFQEKVKNEYLEVKGPCYLSFLEKKLGKNSSGLFVGSSVSHVYTIGSYKLFRFMGSYGRDN